MNSLLCVSEKQVRKFVQIPKREVYSALPIGMIEKKTLLCDIALYSYRWQFYLHYSRTN